MRQYPLQCLVMSISFTLFSCTTIQVVTHSDVEVHKKFGVVNILEVEKPAIIESRVFGIGSVNKNLILGYLNEQTIILDNNQCVVYLDSDSSLKNDVIDYLVSHNCNFIYQQGREND